VSIEGDVLIKRLRKQAIACEQLGSPLYAFLLRRAADDVAAEGPVLDVMRPLADEPPGAAVALKLMGAVHRLVLEGEAPGLSDFYPSVGGHRPIEGSWEPFLEAVRHERMPKLIHRNVQTNEVGRAGGLIGGFLRIAERFGLPMRLLEIGSSGGLNLRWDHFFYRSSTAQWGDPSSPVRLEEIEVPIDPSPLVEVVSRCGSDPHPVDAATREGRLTLSSYVWPDQTWRWAQLEGALEIAQRVPVELRRVSAEPFLAQELAASVPGVVTVVMHSVMIQYLSRTERDSVIGLIEGAGARATADTPLAWLRMEPPWRHFGDPDSPHGAYFPEPPAGDGVDELALVHLNTWPGPPTETIARAGYHGRPVITP
jgi:hypothetical protein